MMECDDGMCLGEQGERPVNHPLMRASRFR